MNKLKWIQINSAWFIYFIDVSQYEGEPVPERNEERENVDVGGGGDGGGDTESSENSDVETELFIGRPEKRMKHNLIMEK